MGGDTWEFQASTLGFCFFGGGSGGAGRVDWVLIPGSSRLARWGPDFVIVGVSCLGGGAGRGFGGGGRVGC